jgi:hypothetical protein
MKTMSITFSLAVLAVGAVLAWHAYQTHCAIYGQVCSFTHCSPICQDNLKLKLQQQ